MNTSGPGIGHGKRKRDPDLVDLVEEYLLENWASSFINIEDMIEKLQSRSFRYSRMKKQAFTALVHKAYEEYCRRKTANSSQDEPSVQRPGISQPQRPIQDINVLSSDDSDVEIEEPSSRTSLVNSQLSVLYGSGRSTGRQITYGNKPTDVNQTSTPKKRRDDRRSPTFIISASPTPIAELNNVALAITSRPHNVVLNSELPAGLTVSPISPINGTHRGKSSDHESDNDLEIIDEVTSDRNSRSSVVSAGSEKQSPRTLASQTSLNLPANIPGQITIISLAKIGDTAIKDGNKSGNQNQTLVRSGNVFQDKINKDREAARNNVPKNTDFEAQRGTKRKPGKNSTLSTASTTEIQPQPKKLKREMTVTTKSAYKLEDFAGSEHILEEICKLLMHLKHPEVYRCLGVTAPRGFLLHGPPGCGKTLLANAIAGELEMPMLKMAATELVSGVSGESESNIRDLFNQALSLAPCIVFIDEIDAVTPKRETAQREMERRIVAQLLACIDDLATKEKGDQVLLIGATNRIEAIDTGLRRAGRFDREICLGIPDVRAREKIIRVICRGLRLTPNFDFALLSKLTPGYVGADLQSLTREAAVQAVNKILTKPNKVEEITGEAFEDCQVIGTKSIGENKNEPGAEAEKPSTSTSIDTGTVGAVDDSRSNSLIQVAEASVTHMEVEITESNGATNNKDKDVSETNNTDMNEPDSDKQIVVDVENESNDIVVSKSVASKSNDAEMTETGAEIATNAAPKEKETNDITVKKEECKNTEKVDNDSSVIIETEVTNNKSKDTEVVEIEIDSSPKAAEVGDSKSSEVTSQTDLNEDNDVEMVETSSVSKVTATGEPEGISKALQNKVPNPEKSVPEAVQPSLAPKLSGKGKLTSLIEKTENTQDNLNKYSPLRWIKEVAPLDQSQLDELFITMDDFVGALKNVQPSAKREGFATVPDITWDDIGALQDIRDELQVAILGPVKHAAAFLSLGLNTPAGSLLCGPPGVGKTLLAKAVANEAGINFISVKGPELLNMYVGESERAVRQCFIRARNSAPCVIFFDELDALCPRRSEVAESGSGSRIVNQLLTEMDGMESRLGVFVMAATNRPDIIDPAILRPGRLDKIFFVDFPNAKDRLEILKAITKNGSKPSLNDDVNLEEIANNVLCDNYTGADLAALVREASITAFRELVLHNTADEKDKVDLKVSKRHFEFALSKTRPSVSKSEREKYDKMKLKFSSLGER